MRIIPSNQSGLALPIALLLLFVMTLVGVTALNTSILEENMTGNSRLRQSALYAAEMALHDAEQNVLTAFTTATERRELFFGDGASRSTALQGLNGDICNGGYCVPAQHDSTLNQPTVERWEDPVLNVWNNPDRHIEYSSFTNPTVNAEFRNQNVLQAPKYIIEFLGNVALKNEAPGIDDRPELVGRYLSSCLQDETTGKILAPNDTWPYCASDPAAFRITVRATAGPTSRQAVVTLQSTVVIP